MREVGPDPRHGDERVAAEEALDAPLVLRLELVVELLADPLAQLGEQRPGVEAGREPLDAAAAAASRCAGRCPPPRRRPGTAPSRRPRRRRASSPGAPARSTRRRTPARRRRRRRCSSGPPSSSRMSFSSRRERDRRDVVAQRREPGLQLGALLLGQPVELDHREAAARPSSPRRASGSAGRRARRRAPRSARRGPPRRARASGRGWRCASPPSAVPAPSPARRRGPSARSGRSAAAPRPAAGRRRRGRASLERSPGSARLGHERELPHPSRAEPVDPQPVGREQLVQGADGRSARRCPRRPRRTPPSAPAPAGGGRGCGPRATSGRARPAPATRSSRSSGVSQTVSASGIAARSSSVSGAPPRA